MKKAIEAIGEQRHENEIIKLISKEQINLIFLFLSGLLIVNLVFAFYRFIILNEIRKFYYQLNLIFKFVTGVLLVLTAIFPLHIL